MVDANTTQPSPASFDAVVAELSDLIAALTRSVCHQDRLACSLRGIAAEIDMTDCDPTTICPQVTMDAIGAASHEQVSVALGIIEDVNELLNRLIATGGNHDEQ